MMEINTEMKNSSLTILDCEESLTLETVPKRMAVSTVKRSKAPLSSGRLSLKPISLLALTQEWLEAENEPLKEVSTSEETKDGEADRQNDVDDMKTTTEIQNASVDFQIQSPEKEKNYQNKNEEDSADLGVLWMDSPHKVNLHTNFDVVTPEINRERSSLLNNIQDFVTPHNPKNLKEDKLVDPHKIRYSINIEGFLKTPNNNFSLRKKRVCQSSTKLASQNASIIRNNSYEDASGGLISDKGTILISSIKNPHRVLQEQNTMNSVPKVQFRLPATKLDKIPTTVLWERNKENLVNKLQVALPAMKLCDETLSEITVKNVTYIILNQLGKGGSSVVYHCYDPKTKNEWAVKKVNLDSDASAVGYINEVKVLERLQKCDRIVKMIDYEHIESEKLLLVVLEKGGQDLSKILKDLSNTSQHLPMHMLIFYWMEMLYAVKQIHENGIIHSDLKPGNFLKAEGGLKLIDFGIAACMQDDMTSIVKNFPVGSLNYISPEALTNEPSSNCKSPSFGKPKFKVSYKSDVWSLGCILYQLVYRKTPFQHIGHMWTKLSAIIDPNHKIDYPQVDWVPSRVVNTIKKCLQYDMKARPSVDELIEEYENIYN